MKTDNRLESELAFIKKQQNEDIAIYGTGKISEKLLEEVKQTDCIYVVDDAKAGNSFCGNRIYSTEEIVSKGIRTILLAATDSSAEMITTRLYEQGYGRNLNIYNAYGELLNDQPVYSTNENKKNVLVIDYRIPQVEESAGERLAYNYMKLFQKMGYAVYLLPANFAINAYLQKYENEGIHVLAGRFYWQYWKEWLSKNESNIDFVFLQRPEPAQMFMDALKAICTRTKIIYHPADLHFRRLEREYRCTGDLSIKEEAIKYKALEYSYIEKSDAVFLVGSVEANLLKSDFPNKTIRDIPIFLYRENDIPKRKRASEREDLLFVGGFAHAPNIDAVKWLAKDIFPRIHERNPKIKCHIVGGGASKELLKYASEYFIFEGFLGGKELEEIYKNTRLAIAPLRFGAGVKGKIVEAAYYGLPVVTTDMGAEGICDAKHFVTVANDTDEYVNKVLELYHDLEMIDTIADKTRMVIEKNYTEETARKIFEDYLSIK